ncbi:hypothetical protein F511_17796 [Dorcoceras hygrometricum]|uniref:Uncharacterized protein n=1 Tax=Dorcoceras hygrometricum TaxID=472368 RepID=A0A2Z7BHL9_9LAMI|nr:hypothetical protein F511_17796 [Dorcoceras hygrometricum]
MVSELWLGSVNTPAKLQQKSRYKKKFRAAAQPQRTPAARTSRRVSRGLMRASRVHVSTSAACTSQRALHALAATLARTSCKGLRAPTAPPARAGRAGGRPPCPLIARRDAHDVQHACCTLAGGGAPPVRRCSRGDATVEFES